jgi:transposase-like protein
MMPPAVSRATQASSADTGRPQVQAAGRADGADEVGERQVPFFCPYCGDEDLRPAGSQPGSWDCQSCRRGFLLRFAGTRP